MDSLIKTEDHKCRRCKTPLVRRSAMIMGIDMGGLFHQCDCPDVIEAEQEERKRLEASQAKLRKLFGFAKVPEIYKTAMLDNFEPRPGTQRAKEAAERMVEGWDDWKARGQGLILTGEPGNGKTRLAATIANELMINRQVNCVMSTVPLLLKKLRSTFSRSSKQTEESLTRGLIEADLLVLDDLGTEKKSAFSVESLYTIIDGRYQRGAPLIITTNHKFTALEEQVGERAIDRLAENCLVIQVTATSMRIEKARAREGV